MTLPLVWTYERARQRARAKLGDAADVEQVKSLVLPCRVGVRIGGRFYVLAAAANWDEAFEELEKRAQTYAKEKR